MLLFALGGWLLWASLKAREAAVDASRAACEAEEFLFLDDTVAIESVWAVRDDEGHLKVRRVYGFEYSDTGNNRRKGSITLLGSTVHAIDVGLGHPPEGETLH